jgi:NDP-sugar pyrophosphorylase family protein
MQAVILAGGLGTRLWPLTREIPKSMVPVAGVPYLEHQLLELARQAITDIVLLTGYLGDQIEAYFGDGRRAGLQIRYSREMQPLGTGGALREARGLLADTFLVLNGDSYLPIDYAAVLHRLEASAALGLLVVYADAAGETMVPPNTAVDSEGFVTCYDKHAADGTRLRYVEAGVLAFRKEAIDLVPAAGVVSFEQEVYPQLIARRQLLGFLTTQRFYDMGTPERLKVIERYLTA